ncbi:MAG: MGMT family protein [Anaerolineae bacterium]|jgi:methylated-DNA-protein-cysteine methyltransferase-like protein|nr:MGMT family protein [Anaerolineae bacterium]
MTTGPSVNERIYMVIRQVPPGKVTTYGQVSKIVGTVSARQVGYALAAVREAMNVPWQRVVNSQGKVSLPGSDQQHMLEAEGVVFDAQGRIDLKRFGWSGPEDAWLEANGFDVTWFWSR